MLLFPSWHAYSTSSYWESSLTNEYMPVHGRSQTVGSSRVNSYRSVSGPVRVQRSVSVRCSLDPRNDV